MVLIRIIDEWGRPVQALDIDQLTTFVAIADTGSFTDAAGRIGRTQSAVSMQMKRLEETVGRPIFARDGRRSRLTDEGARLLDNARRMLALNAETMALFQEPMERRKAWIGLPDDYAPRVLPQVLAIFDRSRPELEIDVRCKPSQQLAAHIRDGTLDLAIVTLDDGLRKSFQDVRIVRREPLFFVGSSHHAAHTVSPLPIAVGPDTCCWRNQAVKALEKAGRSYRTAYTSASAAAISGAVLAGLAVGVLPESAVTPEMRRLGPRDGFPALMPADIAVIRAEHARDPLHDALVEHIANALDNLSMFYRPVRPAG